MWINCLWLLKTSEVFRGLVENLQGHVLSSLSFCGSETNRRFSLTSFLLSILQNTQMWLLRTLGIIAASFFSSSLNVKKSFLYVIPWHFWNTSDELAELLYLSIYTATSMWQIGTSGSQMQTLRFLCSLYGITPSVCCQKIENGRGLWPTKDLMLPTHICRAVTWENDNTQWLRLFPLSVTLTLAVRSLLTSSEVERLFEFISGFYLALHAQNRKCLYFNLESVTLMEFPYIS